MDRGPVALFGAIVAVGLGPAMWLGAQFGSIDVEPSRPPAVVGEQNVGPDRLVGGTGAGANDSGDDSVINATPQSEVVPTSRSASPSRSSTSSPRPSATPSRSSAAPEPSETSAPTTPPTESSTAPTTPAADETTSAAPSTPTGVGASQDGAGTISG